MSHRSYKLTERPTFTPESQTRPEQFAENCSRAPRQNTCDVFSGAGATVIYHLSLFPHVIPVRSSASEHGDQTD